MSSVKEKLKNSNVGTVLNELEKKESKGSILVFKGKFGKESSGKEKSVPFILYNHYAIYMGKDRDGDHSIVHYYPPEDGSKKPVIKKDKLEKIYYDMTWPCCIHNYLNGLKPFSPDEILKRAEEALEHGFKKAYNFLINNCEHFANWCRYGEPCSEQAEKKGGGIIGGVVTGGVVTFAIGATILIGTAIAAPAAGVCIALGVLIAGIGIGATVFGCYIKDYRREKRAKKD